MSLGVMVWVDQILAELKTDCPCVTMDPGLVIVDAIPVDGDEPICSGIFQVLEGLNAVENCHRIITVMDNPET
jgi:hypothetical protein